MTYTEESFNDEQFDFQSEDTYEYCSFERVMIDERFEGSTFKGCTFSRCIFSAVSIELTDSQLTSCKILSCFFDSCEPIDVTFTRTIFRMSTEVEIRFCTFVNCNLSSLYINSLFSCQFESCDLGTLSSVTASECSFTGGYATKVGFESLTACVLTDCRWDEIFSASNQVRETIFKDCNMKMSIFDECEVIDLSFLNCDCAGQTFTESSIQQLSFEDCNTQSSVFNHCTVIELSIKVNIDDAPVETLFDSKAMSFEHSTVYESYFTNVDAQSSVFSHCEMSLTLEYCNVSGSSFFDCSGEWFETDCIFACVTMDERSVEELDICND